MLLGLFQKENEPRAVHHTGGPDGPPTRQATFQVRFSFFLLGESLIFFLNFS